MEERTLNYHENLCHALYPNHDYTCWRKQNPQPNWEKPGTTFAIILKRDHKKIYAINDALARWNATHTKRALFIPMSAHEVHPLIDPLLVIDEDGNPMPSIDPNYLKRLPTAEVAYGYHHLPAILPDIEKDDSEPAKTIKCILGTNLLEGLRSTLTHGLEFAGTVANSEGFWCRWSARGEPMRTHSFQEPAPITLYHLTRGERRAFFESPTVIDHDTVEFAADAVPDNVSVNIPDVPRNIVKESRAIVSNARAKATVWFTLTYAGAFFLAVVLPMVYLGYASASILAYTFYDTTVLPHDLMPPGQSVIIAIASLLYVYTFAQAAATVQRKVIVWFDAFIELGKKGGDV